MAEGPNEWILLLLSITIEIKRRIPSSAMGRAIAVHGGAGIDPCLPMERQQEAKDLLLHYINLGVSALKASVPAIDVVELMVRELENNPVLNSVVAQHCLQKAQ